MATEKQVNYLLYLMSQKGYSTKFMRSEHKELGATMRERHGTVRDWLQDMDNSEVNKLIQQLKD